MTSQDIHPLARWLYTFISPPGRQAAAELAHPVTVANRDALITDF